MYTRSHGPLINRQDHFDPSTPDFHISPVSFHRPAWVILPEDCPIRDRRNVYFLRCLDVFKLTKASANQHRLRKRLVQPLCVTAPDPHKHDWDIISMAKELA